MNEVYAIGFKFSHVSTEMSQNLLGTGLNYGIKIGYYTTHIKGNNYKDLSKKCRNDTHAVKHEEFERWCMHYPSLDWKKLSQNIHKSRIHTTIKNVIWKIITGKLYMGSVAYFYLHKQHNHPWFTDNYIKCPFCPEIISTYKHQFWTCPHAVNLWSEVRNILGQYDNVTVKLESYYDIIHHNIQYNINKDKSVIYHFTNEIITNAIYAI